MIQNTVAFDLIGAPTGTNGRYFQPEGMDSVESIFFYLIF